MEKKKARQGRSRVPAAVVLLVLIGLLAVVYGRPILGGGGASEADDAAALKAAEMEDEYRRLSELGGFEQDWGGYGLEDVTDRGPRSVND